MTRPRISLTAFSLWVKKYSVFGSGALLSSEGRTSARRERKNIRVCEWSYWNGLVDCVPR